MKRVAFINLAIGLLLMATTASATTIDGLSVDFNNLPSSDVTSGLNVSLILPGAHYNGFSSSGVYSNIYYGQTNPFEYNGTTQRSDSTPAFDAVYNGWVSYNYTADPIQSFSILWGSVDPDNQLSFFDVNGNNIGVVTGANLITAIQTAGLGSAQLYGNPGFQPTVDITVSSPTQVGYVTVTGSPNLTFEYSNIITQTAGAVPEPASWAMMLLGFGVIGTVMRRRAKFSASFG